jgi:hypothetical protein
LVTPQLPLDHSFTRDTNHNGPSEPSTCRNHES